jgi:hypothetical protein
MSIFVPVSYLNGMKWLSDNDLIIYTLQMQNAPGMLKINGIIVQDE